MPKKKIANIKQTAAHYQLHIKSWSWIFSSSYRSWWGLKLGLKCCERTSEVYVGVCVTVCEWINICVRISVCVFVWVCVCVYMFMCTYMFVHLCICFHVSMCVYVHVGTDVCVVCVFLYASIYVQMCMCVCSYVYRCLCVCMGCCCSLLNVLFKCHGDKTSPNTVMRRITHSQHY